MKKAEIVIVALALFEMIVTLIFGFCCTWQDYSLNNKWNDIFKRGRRDDN